MSKVYFTKDLTAVDQLFAAAGFSQLITPDKPIALKIHFGEPGNTAYLKPEKVKVICDLIKKLGGQPFYTDCNTLYKGRRQTSKEHLGVAKEHGYTLEQAGADVIIPEEEEMTVVQVDLPHCQKVYLSGILPKVSTIFVLTHFKGHELTGFGGALKNLGMGFGSRLGKLKMHQDCPSCPELKTCQRNQTIAACWKGSPKIVQEKMVEYAYGAVKEKQVAYFNFLTDISPNCDCYDHNDPPIVPDIGVLAGTDPVAIDQASIDLVNKSAGKDIFREIYPHVDWEIQLKYAEKIGLGSRQYELVVK